MSEYLPCVEVGPKDATASVVWLHGLGADGHDFEPVVPTLGCPQVRFVFPHAPSLPVTINGGVMMPAWYDILSLERSDEARENGEHIRASAKRIADLLEREQERGVPANRIVLAGFSQGAAMALFLGPRYPKKLAGIMALSGYHVLPSTFADERVEANQSTEIYCAHGSEDPMVLPAWGRQAKDDMQAWSSGTVHWTQYPMAHEVCPPQLEAIGGWLRGLLA